MIRITYTSVVVFVAVAAAFDSSSSVMVEVESKHSWTRAGLGRADVPRTSAPLATSPTTAVALRSSSPQALSAAPVCVHPVLYMH